MGALFISAGKSVVSRKPRSVVKKNRIMKWYIVNDMIGQLYGHVILTM